MAAKKDNAMIDKLLSVAYSEVEGSKAGDRELQFIECVFDFLNRQSTYLSDKKVADKLIKLTNKTIDNASKKNDAVKKKKKGKKGDNDDGNGKKKGKGKKKKDKREAIYTKADKTVDKEKVADDKKKLKKKIASSQDPNYKAPKDKYSATTKQDKKKAKAKKAKQDKSGNYQNDAPNEEIKDSEETGESAADMIDRIETMYSQFKFNYNKDYKTLIKILGKPASKRVASSYLIEICKIIRIYAPNCEVDMDQTKPIKGTDRAFRVSSNFEGKVYISDFEFAYELVEDPKNDKIWQADMLSNHPICRHDASSVYVDHRSHVFFHELSSFKNEALMVFIPGKPAPKRTIQYKPAGITSHIFLFLVYMIEIIWYNICRG